MMNASDNGVAGKAQFEALLESLCAYFADELERQENVLALCKSQGVAARCHDTEYLEANSAALAQLVQETSRAERERLSVVEVLVAMLNLPKERQTLSALIPLAPDPWSGRLSFYQERLQVVLAEIRMVVRENAPVLRRSLRIVNETIRTLENCAASGSHYTASGAESAMAQQGPAVIDRKG